jgi:hypothetical protein
MFLRARVELTGKCQRSSSNHADGTHGRTRPTGVEQQEEVKVNHRQIRFSPNSNDLLILDALKMMIVPLTSHDD